MFRVYRLRASFKLPRRSNGLRSTGTKNIQIVPLNLKPPTLDPKLRISDLEPHYSGTLGP